MVALMYGSFRSDADTPTSKSLDCFLNRNCSLHPTPKPKPSTTLGSYIKQDDFL